MWRTFVFLAFFGSFVEAKVDPEVLKPCFERYDGHKLIHAQPFHSEWKMPKEEDCLEFCAQSTSRCRSIVYDKMSQICHFFMVDGVELRQVFPQRGMAYFQLADPNCAAAALSTSPTDSPSTTEAYIPPVTEVENGEKIPVMFAPENFPQPPTTTTTSSAVPSEVEPVEDVSDFTDSEDESIIQKPSKKYPKFDEKIDKAGVDEVVTYDDEGNLVKYQTSKTPIIENSESPIQHGHPEGLEDVRVPKEQEQIERPIPSEDSDYHEPLPAIKEEEKEYDSEPTKTLLESLQPSTDFERIEVEATTPFNPPSTPPPTTASEAPEPLPTTSDPRDDELKTLQEQMQLLEKEVLQIREEEARKQQQQQKFNPKLEMMPKFFPPSPMAFMENSVPSILPEMKIFKVARKEFGDSGVDAAAAASSKGMTDIRRAPSKLDKFGSIKAFASSLNSEFEDSECPQTSNLIWIGIENSDLPKIGDLITRKAANVEECMRQCKKIRINGKICNAFGFNEQKLECTYGHEEGMFGVKPTKHYSTRAFKKLCYPEQMGAFRECAEFLAFRDYKLYMAPKEVFDGLPAGRDGVSGCVELCVLSTSFKCRAASFDFSINQCQLFDSYSLSNSEHFKEHSSNSLLYFENGCAIEPQDIKSKDIEEARVQRAALKSDTPLTPVRIDFRKLRA